MKIIVLSDTHGERRVIDQVISREAPFDYLIHCGDSEISLSDYASQDNPYKLLAVRGNCDYMNDLPAVLNVRILSYNVLITHGHHENVHYGNRDLVEIGRSSHADIILYGHTHVPETAEEGGILIINPGSLTYPRGLSRKRTYAVLMLSEEDHPDVVIKNL